jgi:hypothetical protein
LKVHSGYACRFPLGSGLRTASLREVLTPHCSQVTPPST